MRKKEGGKESTERHFFSCILYTYNDNRARRIGIPSMILRFARETIEFLHVRQKQSLFCGHSAALASFGNSQWDTESHRLYILFRFSLSLSLSHPRAVALRFFVSVFQYLSNINFVKRELVINARVKSKRLHII